MAGDEEMQLPRRAPKLEWNLNTLLSLATLTGMVVGGLAIWFDKSRDIEELQTWRTGHEILHKERLAEVKGIEASYREQLRAGEVRDNEFDRKIDGLTQRVTITEQSAVTVTSAIRELQIGQNKQATDIQVIKEILMRMEASQAQKGERR